MKTDQQSNAEHKRLRFEALGRLIDASPVVIFMWRIEPGHWPVEVVSANVQELLGYSAEDFTSGRVSWPGITHPEDVPRLEQEVKDLLAAGRDEWSQQYRLLTKDGKPIWVEDWNRIVQDAAGKAPHIQALVINITERKRAEEELRQSEKRYRTLFESSHDAIMTLEPPSWRFTAGNPATVSMFKAASEKEFISLGPWELSPERQPDERPSAGKAKEMIETAMREGSHFFEWRHVRIGGEEFPATVLLTRMDIGGKTILQATVRDITVAKQLTEDLCEKNIMLDQMVAQLRKLALEVTQTEERERKRLALLLHDDIQQLLAAATMKISLIDRNASSEEHDWMVRSALALIGEALNSSRSLATELYPPVLINGGFLPGVRWLTEWMKERHGLTVELSGEEIEGVSSNLSMLLFRGVRELLFNVVKHAGVKTVSVAVNQPDAKAIQVVIIDHGVGCTGNHAKDLSTCRGLGLLHLRERLANIGGSLDVASVPGQGTTVSITVPRG
jgi:PAS domain S-box-containing protein